MNNGLFAGGVVDGLGWDMPDMPWDSVDAGANTTSQPGGGSGLFPCDPSDSSCIPGPNTVGGSGGGTGYGYPGGTPDVISAIDPSKLTDPCQPGYVPTVHGCVKYCADPCDKKGDCYDEAVCKASGGSGGGGTTPQIFPTPPKGGGGGGGGTTPQILPSPPKNLFGGGSGGSLFSNPWLWVGVAALAAGGIIYATSRKKPSTMRANRRRRHHRRSR